MMRRFFLLLTLLAGVCSGIHSEIKLPAVISDNMVLQQQSDVRLWGTADSGSKVTVIPSWDNRKYTVNAGKDGSWSLNIATPSAGGPYTISISDGTPVTLGNVMSGEVWVCSGQSNMDMRMSGRYGDPVIGAMDAIITSRNPDIRMFTVGAKMTGEPLTDCTGKWEEASPATTPEFSATAYYFARKLNEALHIPVGIIHTSYGGSRVEAWMSGEAVAPYRGMPEVQNECILYNGMMSPLVGYGIKGFLWYQGEANMDYPDLYTRLFPAMVKDYRNRWGVGEFPFLYAQIAPNNYNKGGDGKGKNSAYLREAQVMCLDSISNSGMICLLDAGHPQTIHPMDKETVGNRFAYLAVGKVYGYDGLLVSCPLFKSAQPSGNEITVHFDNVGKGLTTMRQPLDGFEVAGEDRVFHPARARFGKDMQTIIVTSPEVPAPVAVRYAFKDYTKGTLYNQAGLPASSFRSDNW